jgi:signal transduction histidine kinase
LKVNFIEREIKKKIKTRFCSLFSHKLESGIGMYIAKRIIEENHKGKNLV